MAKVMNVKNWTGKRKRVGALAASLLTAPARPTIWLNPQVLPRTRKALEREMRIVQIVRAGG